MENIASETRQKEQQSIPQEKQLRQGELPSNEENVRELDFDINDIISFADKSEARAYLENHFNFDVFADETEFLECLKGFAKQGDPIMQIFWVFVYVRDTDARRIHTKPCNGGLKQQNKVKFVRNVA